jgi:cation diffusion facilitator family transporter
MLAVTKLGIGFSTGAVAILSDGLNSATDLFVTGVAYLAIRRSGEPPNPRYPWGQGKFQSIAGMVEALFITLVGVYVVWYAIQDLFRAKPPGATLLGVLVMAFSAGVNAVMSHWVLGIARKTESIALAAEGHHIRSDVFASGGVLISLLLSRYLHVPHIQEAAAMVVAVFIFRAGYHVMTIAMAPLLDQALPMDETVLIKKLLREDAWVRGFHNLRTRRSGGSRIIDVHVMLPDDMTFVDAHRHTEALEQTIRSAFGGNTDVMIHPEPFLDETAHQQEFHVDEASD